MKDFADKVAVITGAASGLGKAFALEAAGRGMHLVLADINERDLEALEQTLQTQFPKTQALYRVCDVAQAEPLAALADASFERFDKVHLLFNNAGVSAPPRPIWQLSVEDWHWVMNINVQGVFYGIKYFVPRMLEQAENSYIVNTASIAGFINDAGLNAYAASKSAVVAMTETLALDLAKYAPQIRAAVLCPAWTKTDIHKSERNRAQATDINSLDARSLKKAAAISKLIEQGPSAESVIAKTFQALEEERLYIRTHPDFEQYVEARFAAVLAEKAL